jgi:opacity protein-like surface antigen
VSTCIILSTCITRWGKSRIGLRALVSLATFALAVPAVQAVAADMPVKAPAPPADRGEFRAFVEGGAFWTAGDAIPFAARGFEVFSAFPILPLGGASLGGTAGLHPNVGWDAAVGFDYRFAGTPWHVNVQARWGEARGSDTALGASVNQTSIQLRNAVTRQLALSPRIAEVPAAPALPRQTSRKRIGKPISAWDMISSPV